MPRDSKSEYMLLSCVLIFSTVVALMIVFVRIAPMYKINIGSFKWTVWLMLISSIVPMTPMVICCYLSPRRAAVRVHWKTLNLLTSFVSQFRLSFWLVVVMIASPPTWIASLIFIATIPKRGSCVSWLYWLLPATSKYCNFNSNACCVSAVSSHVSSLQHSSAV